MGCCEPGQGRAGQGRAGQGRAGQGKAGQGMTLLAVLAMLASTQIPASWTQTNP